MEFKKTAKEMLRIRAERDPKNDSWVVGSGQSIQIKVDQIVSPEISSGRQNY